MIRIFATLLLAVVFASPVFAYRSLSELPPSPVNKNWREGSISCNIEGKHVQYQYAARQAGVLLVEVDTYVDGRHLARSSEASGIGGRYYLKTSTGWNEFISAEPGEMTRFDAELPATLGLTAEEVKKCEREAK